MTDPALEKLNQALIANDMQSIVLVLTADATLVNRRDALGRVPLDMAVSRSHLEIVELLLARGASVNTHENVFGSSPLFGLLEMFSANKRNDYDTAWNISCLH
jgi:ankyrin repeat protein